jgi:uncharacterized protein (TIGR03663 family)
LTATETKSILNNDLKPVQKPATFPLSWLTVETLLYGCIFVVAMGLRLWRLGATPLNNVEAQQALAALSLYQGETPVSDIYSPLLATFNLLGFLLMSPSDATARLIMTLAGSVLVFLPLLLRRQLGGKVALISAALLAISPTAVFLSRILNGEMLAAVGALMIVAGFFNWVDQGKQNWLLVTATGLAILLTAGPMSFSIIVIFVIIVLIRWSAFKALFQQGVGQAPQPDDSRGLPPQLRHALLFLVAMLLILGTAGTLNLGGLGITSGLLNDWFSRFTFQSRADTSFNAVFLLVIYEPLLIGAGLIGLAYALLSKDLLRQSIAAWFLGMLVLDLLMAGRAPGTVILSLLPLVLLAAIALTALWESLARSGSWNNEGIILGAGLVIFGFAYIGLTGWLERPCNAGDTVCQLAWLQSIAALVLFAVIVIFFWFINGVEVALRGAALTGIVLGILAMVSFGWRLNYGPLMNLVYQPLAGVPAATDLVALRDTLLEESLLRTGDQHMLDVTVVGLDSPALRWQLRDFKNTRTVSTVNSDLAGTVAIITAPTETGEFNLGEAYVGQDFALNAFWSPVGLGAKDLINWLIYRELPLQPESDRVILWLILQRF